MIMQVQKDFWAGNFTKTKARGRRGGLTAAFQAGSGAPRHWPARDRRGATDQY